MDHCAWCSWLGLEGAACALAPCLWWGPSGTLRRAIKLGASGPSVEFQGLVQSPAGYGSTMCLQRLTVPTRPGIHLLLQGEISLAWKRGQHGQGSLRNQDIWGFCHSSAALLWSR